MWYVCFNVCDSCTKRARFPAKRKEEEVTTANHITHLHTQVDCLPSIENGSKSWDGMIQDCGCGVAKTLNCRSRSGCVVATLSGFHAPGFLTFIEVILAHRVIQVPWPVNLEVNRQL